MLQETENYKTVGFVAVMFIIRGILIFRKLVYRKKFSWATRMLIRMLQAQPDSLLHNRKVGFDSWCKNGS